jgi:hypothetical protein
MKVDKMGATSSTHGRDEKTEGNKHSEDLGVEGKR